MLVGIGCDVTHISKFKNKNEYFIDKILTKNEKNIYNKRCGKKKLEFLAGHFSAKESIIKALASEIKLTFQDIDIFYNNDVPSVKIEPYEICISISHDKDIVVTNAFISKK